MTTSNPPILQPIHFLSYSSRGTLNQCAREYQIYKHGETKPDSSSVTFAFGHSVGAGIQTLLAGGSYDEAVWEAFKEWSYHDLFATEMDRVGNRRKKKSFAWACNAIKLFLPFAQAILREWEVFILPSGKPAKELSFTVDLQNGFHYRAHIDIVLRNKENGQLLVVELKTTGSSNVLEATYGNSSQALSYAVVLDKIARGNAHYAVWYFVYKTEDEDYEPLPFTKSILDKAKWIKAILLECRKIQMYEEENFFPQNDHACVRYFHACPYYGSCQMSDKFLLASPETLQERVDKELADHYDFRFTLQEIIDQQLAAT